MKKQLHIFFTTAFIVASVTVVIAQNAIGFGNSEQRPLRGNGMVFTENKGQIADREGNLHPDILYKGDGGGADVYLRKTGISYVTNNMGEVIREIDKEVELKKFDLNFSQQQTEELKHELEAKALIKIQRTDVDFENANPNPETLNQEEVEGYTNYYYAHCPNGITNVKSYNRVIQKNIYAGIDVVYYGGKQNGLKYDLVINPGADPNDIKLKYTGAKVKLEGQKLIVTSELGETVETLPKVYQNINGKIVDVGCEYKLSNSDQRLGNREQTPPPNGYSLLANHYIVTFELGTYNHELPLIIDPWASYYGGSDVDEARSVTTDLAGNVQFAGSTQSVNFPVLGASQGTLAGGYDAFLVKMNSAGTRIFATHFGNKCSGFGITTDATGNVFVTGEVGPTGVIAGASGSNVIHQNTNGGGSMDAFLVKFDAAGSRLWATFYGGTGDDRGWSVCSDGTNVYMSGRTNSVNSIASPGSFQPVINGTFQFDGFIAAFTPNGNRIWSSYVGGSDDEWIGGITYDIILGSIYLTGSTMSVNFPVTPGAHQTSISTVTNSDVFILKMTPSGTMVWSTFYGDNGEDAANHLVTDGIGNVIIVGTTTSNASISTIGSQQPFKGSGMFDIFVVKFNSLGTRLWGTYLGGSSDKFVPGVDVDSKNNIYVVGDWEDNGPGDYLVSPCAIQPVFAGGSTANGIEDQFVAKYDPDGKLKCITHMGGAGEDDMDGSRGGTIAVFGNVLYITGWTDGNYPVSTGAFQTAHAGVRDAFINQLCINLCEEKTLAPDFTSNTQSVCKDVPVTFKPFVSNSCDTSDYQFQWVFTGGTPLNSTALNPVVTYPSSGNYNIKLTVVTPCKSATINKPVYITVNSCSCILSAQAFINTNVTGCNRAGNGSASVTLSGGAGPYSYSWTNGSSGITGVTSTTTINFSSLPATTYTFSVVDGNCTSITTVTITQPPAISITSNATPSGSPCGNSDGSAGVNATGGFAPYSYTWSNGGSAQTISGLAVGSYTVTVRDNIGCTNTTVVNVNFKNPVSAAFIFSQACVGIPVNFTNTGTSGSGVVHNWLINSMNVSGTSTNFSYTFLNAGIYEVTHTVMKNNCNSVTVEKITVVDCSTPSLTTTSASVCPGACAIVTSNATGGSGAYTYSWSTGATTQNINPCPTATTTYTVKVTDAGGATATSTAVVAVNTTITITATSTNITCNGKSDGSITATPAGGTPAFNYVWNNGITTATGSNLAAGNYTVTVTDSKGCTAISTTTITAPPALLGQYTKGTANCPNCGCKEWVMVNATGGTSPYTYTWPDGYANRYKNQLCPGAYLINIKDKNGCSVTINLTTP